MVLERLRVLPLQVWGVACIVGGFVSGVIGKSLHPPRNRSELLGQGLAQLLLLIVGTVLVAKGELAKRRG